MYVDGTPILRNVLDVTGIQHDDSKPWILGAGLWDETLTDGWNGCIGETRLVTEPLEENQWLTARAADEMPGTDDVIDEPTAAPTEGPSPAPTEEPTDVETDPTTEPRVVETEQTGAPSEDDSEAVASSTDTNRDDLTRTYAGVLWLIVAGVAAIAFGALTILLRRRHPS